MPEEKQQLKTNLLGRQAMTTIEAQQRVVEIVGVYWQVATDLQGGGWSVLARDSHGEVHDLWLRHVRFE